jgi:membrane protein YqaA with SNARE-associated domain
MNPKQRLNILRALILIGVIALTIYLVSIRDQVKQLGAYGYPGIFLVSILINATIIVPVPGVLLTSAMGAVFNPFWVAVAAGLGASIGELSGYLAGFSGQGVIENAKLYARLTTWMKKYGDITILVLAFIPNPAFDVAGMIAGVLRMNILKFLFYCAIGKILKMMIFAYTGSSIFNLFQ